MAYSTQNTENNAGGMGGIYVNETFAKDWTCIHVVLLNLTYYIYSSLTLPFVDLKRLSCWPIIPLQRNNCRNFVAVCCEWKWSDMENIHWLWF